MIVNSNTAATLECCTCVYRDRFSLVSKWKYEHIVLVHLAYLVGEGNGTPLQYSCLENPMDGGAW